MTRVNHHLIKELSSITNKYRPIELLEGLSALCSCKGLPIKQNQSKINPFTRIGRVNKWVFEIQQEFNMCSQDLHVNWISERYFKLFHIICR